MSRSKRLCLIGLDGVPEQLLRRLADDGVMPRLAERIAGQSWRARRDTNGLSSLQEFSRSVRSAGIPAGFWALRQDSLS